MINPKPGEVYWVDLGLKGKLRPLLVVSREDADAERALCVCVPLTTQIRGGDYEVKLRACAGCRAQLKVWRMSRA
jgi:mRNA interferase MazF